MSNFIPPSQNGQIVEVDFRDLIDHPLLAGIPTWETESAEAVSLRESIRERGLDYPILIDNQKRVVDGRNRRNAIRALGRLPMLLTPTSHALAVPCRVVDEAQAASVIVSSLVNRRHLSKGALAYLVAPLFEGVLAESKHRNLAMLRAGGASVPHSAGNAPKTAEEVAAGLGIGHTLFEQALQLRRMFEGLSAADRAKYEPRILGEWQDAGGDWQDPVGLGYMINGLTSLADEATKKKNLGKRAQHDRLFTGFLPKLNLHWDKANPEQRLHIAAGIRKAVLQFDAGLREEFAAALKAAAKADHA